MKKSATTRDFDKISALIFNGDTPVGSGCFLWSEDGSTLYCITADHCTSNKTAIKTYVDENLKELTVEGEKVCNDTNDIAIYRMELTDYTRTIPNTLTSNLLTPPRRVVINGYPLNLNKKRTDIKAEYMSMDDNKINLNVPSLDANTVDRFDEVSGISGSGCYEVIDNTIKFIGIENKAINKNVTFKELHAIRLHVIADILIMHDLPELPASTPSYITNCIGNYQTLDKSLAKQNYKNKWVNLDISEVIKKSVIDHFENKSLVLYLCGVSGIGKTRGVLNACISTEYRSSIFYETYEEFYKDKNDIINHATAYFEKFNIIIDEVKLENYNDINNSFMDYKDYFKFVLIGTVSKNQVNKLSNIIYLSQIEKEDIKSVVSGQYPSFSREELYDIYNLSHNDLRLATLISRLYAKEKECDFTMPVLKGSASKLVDEFSSAESILKKTIKQHREIEPEEINIKHYFNRLSLFVDIGYKGVVESEIRALALYFNEKDDAKFKSAIRHLLNINLGIDKLNYFELSPRALAKLAFEQQGWELIRDNIDSFMEAIPNDLMRKRFFDRVDECALGEVNEAIASWFRNKYTMGSLESVNYYNAKEIMMYIEHSPHIGLIWLKGSILKASSDEIKQFHGTCGRRNVVWTCEHLSNFKEWFFDCEEILYKLAQSENEKGISNNSQGVWSSMFSPVLSNTEVSYYERFDILIKRALECNQKDEFDMFKSAFTSALNLNGGIRSSPPQMVGGTITPPNWQPKTLEEIVSILKLFLEKIDEIYGELHPIIKNCIFEVLRNNISAFLPLRLLTELKVVMSNILTNQQQKDKFIINLEWQLRLLDKYKESSADIIADINCWIDELQDITLQGRINNFLVRGVYSYGYDEKERLKWEAELSALAKEVFESEFRNDILITITIKKEFNNEPMSRLAEAIAKIDKDVSIIDFVVNLLNNNLCDNFARGYFLGAYYRQRHLPQQLVVLLDEFKNIVPGFVLWATTTMDITEDGYLRIVDLLDLSENISVIQNMRYKEWFSFLNNKQKIIFLNSLSNCENAQKYALCFELIYSWISQGDTFEELYYFSITIFRQCLEVEGIYELYTIKEMYKKFPSQYHNDILELMISIFDFNESYSYANPHVIDFIDSIKDENNERKIMEFLGEKLLESGKHFRGPAMCGFFNRFSIQTVIKWIESEANKRAHIIAYHLNAPTLENANISPLTEVVLKTYDTEEVYKSFIFGGHNFKVYKPEDYYNQKEQWYSLLERYETSNITALKKWAIHEKQSIKEICNLHESDVVEMSRYE